MIIHRGNFFIKAFYFIFFSVFCLTINAAPANQPKKPAEIVAAWATAAKSRDGKIQYALLCPDQQKKYRKTFENLNWVTGVSSPQIKSFKVSTLKQNDAFSEFNIRYEVGFNQHSAGFVVDRLRVADGCIARFKYLSPAGMRPVKK